MEKPSLAVCTPSGREPRWAYTFSLARLVGGLQSFSRATVQIELGYATDAARMRLVHLTKSESFTRILFIDDDMSFPADTADRLLGHNKDIVAANYTNRVFPITPLAVKDGKHYASRGRKGIEQVEAAGTGIMLIRTSVFDKLPMPWFQTTFQPETPLDPMSDDIYFCRKARGHGFEIWIDHDLSLEIGHVGTLEYNHMMAPGADQEEKPLVDRMKEMAALKLVINLATRGRADLCIETLRLTLPNISEPNTLLIVSMDHDDPESIEKITKFAEGQEHLFVSVREREDSFGAKYNRMLEWDADVYMGMVDYIRHLTPGFDKIVLDGAALFEDGIGAVYSDYIPNGSFTKINAATKKLVEKMGFFYPPWFPYWFVDHWFDDIVRITERYSYVPLNIDISKRPGTRGRRDCGFWATLFDALYLRRRKQALSIINDPDFQEPDWRKKVLISRIPLVEHRSRLVNDSVRSLPPEPITGIPDDERYARVKAKGKALLRELISELEQTEEQS